MYNGKEVRSITITKYLANVAEAEVAYVDGSQDRKISADAELAVLTALVESNGFKHVREMTDSDKWETCNTYEKVPQEAPKEMTPMPQ